MARKRLDISEQKIISDKSDCAGNNQSSKQAYDIEKLAPPIQKAVTPSLMIGVSFAIVATIIFACQDAITKTLVQDYPITFIVMVRYWVFFLAGCYMVKQTDGGFKANIKSKRPLIQFLRGLLLLLELIAVGLSLKTLELSGLTALFQSYPLFGTLLAIFLLKEQVGWQSILALFVGFIGILIMLRPGSSIVSLGAIWAIVATLFYAFYLALTRLVGTFDKPQTSFFYVGLVGLILTTIGLPFFWVTMNSEHIWFLALLCCTSVAGHFLMIKALSLAPLTVLQPFNYLQLVWSVIIGFFIFHEMPDGFTFLGAALIVGSGLFVFFREQAKISRNAKLKA